MKGPVNVAPRIRSGSAALEIETLKASRAPVFRWGAVSVMVGVPALTAVFFALVRMGGDSTAALKARTMITDDSLVGFLGVTGQILSMSLMLSAGIAAAWSFGREFVDGAAPALFAIATPRAQVAAAKEVVLVVWAVATVLVTVVSSVLTGLAMGLGQLDATSAAAALKMAVGGADVALLAIPFGLVASWRRGYLPGFVALVLVVIATQVATVMGAGGWFPYAAPSLWLGMGGPEEAAKITAGQLALPLVVAAVASWGTMRWWKRAEIS